MTLPNDSSSATANVAVSLAPILDVRAAEPLKLALLATDGAEVVLDGSNVDTIGGLCLQVLLSAARSFADEGRRLSIDNPSSKLIAGLVLFGLSVNDLQVADATAGKGMAA